MRKLFFCISTITMLATTCLMAGKSAAAPKTTIGLNLAGLADYSTELPFVDVFRTARAWISQRKGDGWGKGPELSLDEKGWIKNLEEGCFAETPICTIQGGHYPEGEYTVLYEGQGKLTFNNAAIVSDEEGKIVIRPNPAQGGFFLQIMETDPDNYIRNIRVFMPGFDEKSDRFHPTFIERWAGLSCYRFMDFMHTNGSAIEKWEDRPQMDDFSWTRKGAPLEVMIELSNKQKIAPWFCMPHRADDNYIRKFAEMVKEKLDPSLKVYIEYSNEVWNGQFLQAKYAAAKGIELGMEPTERPWEIACKYYSTRSVEIFKIWNDVYGKDDSRLIRVLAWHAVASPEHWIKNLLLATADAGEIADALAIAPYFSLNVPMQGNGLTTAQVETWSIEQVLDHLENTALPDSIKWMGIQAEVAREANLLLLCYEAGQHAVGVGGGENNNKVTELLHAANRDPRMGKMYTAYMDGWKEAGGDMMAIFSSISNFSKWGSWGILEYYDSLPSESPKYQAVVQWAQKNGQPVKEVTAKKD